MDEVVDILVTTYNTNEKYLKKQIESILRQTYKNIKIYISDDNSNKNEIKELLEEYEKNDNRIRLFLQPQNLGYNKIQEIEHEVISYARQELSKLDYLTLYTTPNEENHSSVISFNINGVHPHDVASILDSEGVCVRSGNHCAQPLMRFLGIDSTCRASFYIYNTKDDVDKLVKALDKAYNIFKNYIK
jgi:cellulose synthase/poly-beta-1,6-N-acetylglucosamine synthase-like glycosyltransferase